MKTKYLPLAGLFIIGTLGASNIADIARPITERYAISGAIYNESLIAIENIIIEDDIQGELINAEITQIAA